MQSAAPRHTGKRRVPRGLQCLCGAGWGSSSYPPFCSPVAAGPLNIMMDLFAPEIRKYSLAVWLIKVEGGEEREVLSVPAQEYESGNIALAVDLEPLAKYNILLIGNNEAGDPDTLVTIPLEARRAGDFVHTSKGTGWDF